MRKSLTSQTLVLACAWALLAWLPLANANANWFEEIGFLDLTDLLGAQMPTGNGVFVSQVEASQSSIAEKFFPELDPNNTVHFDDTLDPFGEFPTLVNGSAATHPNPTVSSHATNVVANVFYGDKNGQAPGANTVVVYQADDYMRTFLNCGSGSLCGTAAPDAPTFVDPADGQTKQYVIQNHSWAGEINDGYDVRVLRKLDYIIDEYEVTMAVGVSNGDADPNTARLPHPNLLNLLGLSYNAIAVGVSDGTHAIGPTSLGSYGTGRQKPTIVSPLGSASSATATVSGAATILYDLAGSSFATRSEAMRAIILAGATKDEFIDFVDPGTLAVDPWNRTSSQPLDSILGVGELNVLNNFLITEGGRAPGTLSETNPVQANLYGWDYHSVTSTSSRFYEFEIPVGSVGLDFSVILTWNVDVNSTNFSSQTLADLDLTLTRTSDPNSPIIDFSDSSDENIEHIYIGAGQAVEFLTPGTYQLEVSGNLTRDFGLAWRTSTAYGADPNSLFTTADFDQSGTVDGLDFLAWQTNQGQHVGAVLSQGDADGDGDVDDDDLSIFYSQYGTSPPSLTTFTVPEPGTVVLLVLGGLGLGLPRRRWR